ncbi:MAG: hypothetical protein J5535_01100, partial [Firmicutes bacterium]|nr:hypothetical protein [Bacillota bacterium]
NADFHYKTGLSPKIVRTAEAKCCDWCASLEGEYDYPLEDTEVYRRHDNCRCIVEYKPGDGRKQDVHTKQWENDERDDRVERARGLFDQSRKQKEERERNRQLNYGSGKLFERDNGTINARKLEHFTHNNLYVDNSLNLRTRDVKAIDGQITQAKELLGLTQECKAQMVIVNDDNTLASYNPKDDVFYISSRLSDIRDISEIQKHYVCSDDPRSTMVHELFHWKDAEDYRSSGKTIDAADVSSEYSIYQREKAYKELLNLGVDPGDINAIKKVYGEYAWENALVNNYEEVYTEIRTFNALKSY